mmetsp:Transcript_26164/g.39601  ORF Transcript_26164/g.39601 Transcript_26164/m.39601 type:complete len:140 (-) Transcript_26164:219-638(-)
MVKFPKLPKFPSREERIERLKANEEAALTPPSKIMDASSHAQHLVLMVKRTIEQTLKSKENNLQATQMITRTFTNCNCNKGYRPSSDAASLYFIKVKTSNKEWPWIFVKLYEPPVISSVSPVRVRGLKKMKEEYELVTF